VQKEPEAMQDEMTDEISHMKRRQRDHHDREKQELHDQNIKLNKQLTILKVEVCSPLILVL
jgi:hypothetical protein